MHHSSYGGTSTTIALSACSDASCDGSRGALVHESTHVHVSARPNGARHRHPPTTPPSRQLTVVDPSSRLLPDGTRSLAREAAGCNTVGDLVARPELVAELPLKRLERRKLALAVERLRKPTKAARTRAPDELALTSSH